MIEKIEFSIVLILTLIIGFFIGTIIEKRLNEIEEDDEE